MPPAEATPRFHKVRNAVGASTQPLVPAEERRRGFLGAAAKLAEMGQRLRRREGFDLLTRKTKQPR